MYRSDSTVYTLVTESFTLNAGTLSVPAFNIFSSACTPVVVSSLRPRMPAERRYSYYSYEYSRCSSSTLVQSGTQAPLIQSAPTYRRDISSTWSGRGQ